MEAESLEQSSLKERVVQSESAKMIVFQVEIHESDISSYMASHFLPDYFQNMRMEKIVFDPGKLNWNGTQPLVLTYSVPGRVEDFELHPQKHAFSILRHLHPFFQEEKAAFIPNASLWIWDSQMMRIHFMLKELETQPSGEVYGASDAYVSFSRRKIFLSFDVIQEYLAAQFGKLGLEMGAEDPIRWDDSIGGLVYRSGNVTVQWVLSDCEALQDLLRFLGLDSVLSQMEDFVDSRFRVGQITEASLSESGLTIPLVVEETPSEERNWRKKEKVCS